LRQRRRIGDCGKEKAFIQKLKETEEESARKIKLEAIRLDKEAKQRAEQAIAVELKDLQTQVAEKERKLLEAQKAELEFRKQRRDLEEKQRNLELEMNRRLDEEKSKIREEAMKSMADEYRLKDLEKEKKISDMLKQIEELKRKGEQGSQQAQEKSWRSKWRRF